jgi:hypothetical protein
MQERLTAELHVNFLPCPITKTKRDEHAYAPIHALSYIASTWIKHFFNALLSTLHTSSLGLLFLYCKRKWSALEVISLSHCSDVLLFEGANFFEHRI